MKKSSTIFLQFVVVFLAILTVIILLWFPLTEGRATNLDLFNIYADPFIIYGYISSIAFFIALSQVFRLLGYIRQNKLFSLESVRSLRNIKYCAIILSSLIIIAAICIRVSFDGNPDDDPAGFISISIIFTFISIIVATVTAVFERALQSAVNMKSENDLTI